MMAPLPAATTTRMIGWSASAFVAAVLARLIQKGLALLAELDDTAAGHLRRLEGLLPAVWRVLDAADAGALDIKQRPLKELLDTAYAADDALDDHEYALLDLTKEGKHDNGMEARAGVAETTKPRSPLRCFLCFTTPTSTNASTSAHGDISKEKNNGYIDGLKDAFEKVAQAAYRCTSMYDHVVSQKNYATIITDRLEDRSVGLGHEHDIFGREVEVEQVLEKVKFGDDPHYRLGVGVLPVVGVAGVGKTAFAQVIFRHEILGEEFPVRMWVHVSDVFDVRRLMIQMIRAVSDGEMPYFDPDAGVEDVKKVLMGELDGRRFLLVLDDVLELPDGQWNDLRKAFKTAARRSLVLVTTQSENVARTIGTMEALRLSTLPWDDYWKMFKQFSFGADEFEDFTPFEEEWDDLEHEELTPAEQIAWKIAKKLNGLPLLAKALGRALYYRQEESHWNNVLEDELWERPEVDDISPALRLSYQHLDPRLKQCFGYCAVFPTDYIFQKDQLVQMWVAQGLIYSDAGARSEDVGGDFFDELTERCFFQPIGSNRYLMHNSMQELARAVSSNRCFMITDSSGEVPQEVRHLTIRSSNLSKLKKDLALHISTRSNDFLHRVRTLLFFAEYDNSDKFCEVLDQVLSKTKSVRVLGLSSTSITNLPGEIGFLRHMRYLDLSGNRIAGLPETLCRLYLLQVLNLQPCPDLYPPTDMTNLIHLRHLYASTWFVSRIPQIQNLSNLQEFETFRVGISTSIDALRSMTQLRGTLCIRDLRQVNVGEAKKGILKATKHLSTLYLSWGGSEGQIAQNVGGKQITMDEEVIECLQPHENLKELRISGYGGTKSPSWMLQSCCLSNATSVYLTDCMNWKSLPPLHLLPSLEVLEIKRMHSIKKVSIPQHSNQELFAKLRRIVFEDVPNCTEWSGDSTGADSSKSRSALFPRLRELEIRNCPKLKNFPDLPLTLTDMTVENVGLETLPRMHDKKLSTEEAAAAEGSSNNRWTSPLATLHINGCPKLKSLGSGLLQQQKLLRSLANLAIKNCENVVSDLTDGFKELTALRNLSLYDCPKLLIDKFHTSLRTLEISECFVLQGAWADEYPFLFSVWTLKISGCSHVSTDQESQLETLDWLNCLFNVYSLHLENTLSVTLSLFDKLRSLEILEIDGCRAFFEDELDFEGFNKLQFLSIRNCRELACLPGDFSTLPVLEELCIENCRLITALPRSGLPLSLKRLSICRCSPRLTQRCQDDDFDRPKIAHIPFVYIDGECILSK